jgi:hypothetical protein
VNILIDLLLRSLVTTVLVDAERNCQFHSEKVGEREMNDWTAFLLEATWWQRQLAKVMQLLVQLLGCSFAISTSGTLMVVGKPWRILSYEEIGSLTTRKLRVCTSRPSPRGRVFVVTG